MAKFPITLMFAAGGQINDKTIWVYPATYERYKHLQGVIVKETTCDNILIWDEDNKPNSSSDETREETKKLAGGLFDGL